MCHAIKRFRLFISGNLGFSGSIGLCINREKGRFVGILNRELLIFDILDKDVSEMHGS